MGDEVALVSRSAMGRCWGWGSGGRGWEGLTQPELTWAGAEVLWGAVLIVIFFFFLSFVFFVVVVAISWAAPAAYGGSQARG